MTESTHRLRAATILFAVCALARAAAAGDVPFRTVVIDAGMAGDLDGDGRVDLVVGGMPFEGLAWYRWPAWTKTTIAIPDGEFTTDGALGDVDGDGDLDVIVPDGSGSQNLVWLANPRPAGSPAGAPWIRRVIGTIGGWGKDVEPADLDGDGRLDVATRSGGEAMVFFQVAPLAWSRVPLSGVAVGSEGLASGDVDGDDDWDLLGSNWTGHPPVRLFENLSSAAPSGPLGLYTTSPCRLVDTGIPGTARALSANLVITQPTAAGYLTLAPGGSPRPPTSILNYVAAQTRANQAIVRLSGTGQFDAWCTQASGTAHLVIDVNGWFE